MKALPDLGEEFRTEKGRVELQQLLPKGWRLFLDLRVRPGKGRGSWKAWNGEYGDHAVNFYSSQFQTVMTKAWMFQKGLIYDDGTRIK